MQCYCGSKQTFSQCCQPFIKHVKPVENCEQLMRSRYSAYCLKDAAYIYATNHPSMQADNSLQQITDFANTSHFINLQVFCSKQDNTVGSVQFMVSYLQGNVLVTFTETSRFVFEQNWLYTAGQLIEQPTVKNGRNDLCPCGSKKKFKQCLFHLPSGSLN